MEWIFIFEFPYLLFFLSFPLFFFVCTKNSTFFWFSFFFFWSLISLFSSTSSFSSSSSFFSYSTFNVIISDWLNFCLTFLISFKTLGSILFSPLLILFDSTFVCDSILFFSLVLSDSFLYSPIIKLLLEFSLKNISSSSSPYMAFSLFFSINSLSLSDSKTSIIPL